MNNVKETITEGVNNAMVYRVYAGVDEHLHLALFDGSINSSRLLNVCINVTPEDLSDKLKTYLNIGAGMTLKILILANLSILDCTKPARL